MFALPLQISAVMRDFKPSWFVAGGWAIDLFLEKETRLHQDIEVAIFRKDQIALQDYFDGWLLQKGFNKQQSGDGFIARGDHEPCICFGASKRKIGLKLNKFPHAAILKRVALTEALGHIDGGCTNILEITGDT